jgi:superfamily II DNA/RNA helicase
VPEELRFGDFALSDRLKAALEAAGFQKPTTIQVQAIPPALQGRDILGKSQTGTGKTLAFGIPLLHRVDFQRVATQALVLTPTRELALQVMQHLKAVGEPLGARMALLIGGEDMTKQVMDRTGAQVVIGTPGRVLDMLKQRYLHLGWLEVLVLDEFDRMLDIGFIDEVSAIVNRLPKERQTMLFSATLPSEIERIALRFVRDPVRIEVAPGLATVETIRQRAVRVRSGERVAVLRRLLSRTDGKSVMVFCNRIDDTVELGRTLSRARIPCGVLQGRMEQDRRFAVMERFRNGAVRVLVATDVAARGIDIDHVGLIVNFSIPWTPEDYVHRIGRTGRMGRTGEVVTFVTERDGVAFEKLREKMGSALEVEGAPLGSQRLEGRGERGDRPPARHGRRAGSSGRSGGRRRRS